MSKKEKQSKTSVQTEVPQLPSNGFSTDKNRSNRRKGLDMDMIVPHLYLGSYEAAEEYQHLKHMNISRILTLHETPLDDEVNEHFTYLFKQVVDAHWSDLLCILEECIEFIHEAVSNSTGVLVHWLDSDFKLIDLIR